MKKTFILCITIGFVLVGCKNESNSGTPLETNESNSNDPQVTSHLESSAKMEFELYNNKSLRIAVVGEPPEVREEQIKFNKISFSELASVETNSYDAVFIMKENLEEASEVQYKDIYLNSYIPYFFVSSESLIPFTSAEDIKYSDTWEWKPGLAYISGVYNQQNKEEINWLGFGLYNDEKTEENIKVTYSLVFKKIEELNL